jgi:hypothetical protein
VLQDGDRMALFKLKAMVLIGTLIAWVKGLF